MKKIKYLIIALAILIILLVTIIVVLLKEPDVLLEERQDVATESKIALEKETSIATVVQANELINQFFSDIGKERQNILSAYNMLDKKYIQDNQITQDNIIQLFNKYQNVDSYSSKEIYVEQFLQGEEYVNIFLYIQGKVRTNTTTNTTNREEKQTQESTALEKNAQTEDVYIILKQDLLNYTYSIEFITKEQYNTILSNGYIQKTTIPNNEYNKINIKTVSDYEACVEHMKDYMGILRSNIEEAYNILDNDFKQKRFGNIEAFRQYVQENMDPVNRTGFTKYATNIEGDYTQYICEDNYGYTYVFTEKYPMQYTLQLDTYTIETNKFINQYVVAKDEEKAKINVQKFIYMINNQDYKNAYEKLDATFKQNNFKTQQEFTSFIKANMFKYNQLSIQETTKMKDTYLFTAVLTDLTNGIYKDPSKNQNQSQTQGSGTEQGNNQKANYKYNIVIKLLEGTDFVMSFSLAQ